MASALSENPASVIHSLNLAHNTLDNQGNDLSSCSISFFPSFTTRRLSRIVVAWRHLTKNTHPCRRLSDSSLCVSPSCSSVFPARCYASPDLAPKMAVVQQLSGSCVKTISGRSTNVVGRSDAADYVTLRTGYLSQFVSAVGVWERASVKNTRVM